MATDSQPEMIPMPRDCTDEQLREFARDGDMYSLFELERRGLSL
jgi:hypothetical protein